MYWYVFVPGTAVAFLPSSVCSQTSSRPSYDVRRSFNRLHVCMYIVAAGLHTAVQTT